MSARGETMASLIWWGTTIHPSIWKLIETLQKEEARVHLVALNDSRGIRCGKRIQKSTQLLQDRLKNLCKDYLAGRKNIAHFLKGVSHNIRFGQPNV